MSDRAARRIAVISMHTSPTASLGENANGGLNVYVREIAGAFSDRGIATDIFTRKQTSEDPVIEQLAALSRVIYLPAGRGLDKYSLYDQVTGYGADPERVRVVPPGVDLSVFQPIDRGEARRKIGYGPGRMLLFVGRLERLKGVEVAIRALALLRDRSHDDVRLVILGEDSKDGDESEKERLKSVARDLGVRDRVDFLGSVAHHELPYFYSAADVNPRSEEHTSELQSLAYLVCRLLLEKKKKK